MDSAGLYAMAALPIIVIMYLLRPRVQTRRIASIFLWNEIAQSTTTASTQKTYPVLAFLDISTACILIALAGGLASRTQPDQSDSLWSTGLRCTLCIVAAAAVIGRCWYARSKQIDMRKQA